MRVYFYFNLHKNSATITVHVMVSQHMTPKFSALATV